MNGYILLTTNRVNQMIDKIYNHVHKCEMCHQSNESETQNKIYVGKYTQLIENQNCE